MAAGICDLMAQSARPDRPFDLVLWIRARIDDGSTMRQCKPAIAVALLNDPAMAGEPGVDTRPLRQGAGLKSDRTHTADWAESAASYDALISDEAAIGYAPRLTMST
jgi:hypothetical protein